MSLDRLTICTNAGAPIVAQKDTSQATTVNCHDPGLEYSLELEYYGQGTETGEEYPVLLTTCIWAFDVPEHPCLSWMV